MSNVFKNGLDINILYDFLKVHCLLENDYYIIDKLIFKKYQYSNLELINFYDKIKPWYIKSKKIYVEREINYNNVLTIIRHMCKYHNIVYYSKIKYDKNKYYITYYIKNIK